MDYARILFSPSRGRRAVARIIAIAILGALYGYDMNKSDKEEAEMAKRLSKEEYVARYERFVASEISDVKPDSNAIVLGMIVVGIGACLYEAVSFVLCLAMGVAAIAIHKVAGDAHSPRKAAEWQ